MVLHAPCLLVFTLAYYALPSSVAKTYNSLLSKTLQQRWWACAPIMMLPDMSPQEDLPWSFSLLLLLLFVSFSLFFLNNILVFFFLTFYLFMAVLGLCCNVWASHRGGFLFMEQALPSSRVSLVATRGLSCSAACGIFPHRTGVLCTGRGILQHCTTKEVLVCWFWTNKMPWILQPQGTQCCRGNTQATDDCFSSSTSWEPSPGWHPGFSFVKP